MDIQFKCLIHIGDGMNLHLRADNIAQVSENLRMFLIHFHSLFEVLSGTPAAAEKAKSLFQHHAGVDRNRVLGYAQKGDGPFRMDQIDDLIDIYLLDCKSLSRKVSSIFCGSSRYADVIIPVMDYIKERHPKTDLDAMKGTILRHLVFPGTVSATRNFLRYFASHYKDSFFLSLMVQFVPPKMDVSFPEMSDEEYDGLVELLEELDIDNGFMQERGDDILWIPDFTKDVPFPENFAVANPYFLSLKGR